MIHKNKIILHLIGTGMKYVFSVILGSGLTLTLTKYSNRFLITMIRIRVVQDVLSSTRGVYFASTMK